MYILPSDGIDRNLDTNGTIARAVNAGQKWLVTQSGGQRLRYDTYHGALDITFFRMSQTDKQVASAVAYVRDRIEAEIRAAGFTNIRKIYAVFYDGTSTYACGGGAWPPELVGNVAALYLRGSVPTYNPCSAVAFSQSEDAPAYWEFSLIHEIFHTLGAVADCAPHHALRGHVGDDARDLMYSGTLSWRPSLLDIGHDDYFRNTGSGCVDVSQSAFMDPAAPNAVLPPSWPAK